jgi:phage tail tape-measure protein
MCRGEGSIIHHYISDKLRGFYAWIDETKDEGSVDEFFFPTALHAAFENAVNAEDNHTVRTRLF